MIADAGYAVLYFDAGSIRRFDLGPLLDQPVFRPRQDCELFGVRSLS